jgi:hypothetical protein
VVILLSLLFLKAMYIDLRLQVRCETGTLSVAEEYQGLWLTLWRDFLPVAGVEVYIYLIFLYNWI